MRGLLNYNIAAFESNNYYGFPEISPYTDHVKCDSWIDFDTARSKRDRSCKGVHFFEDDYKFNSIWEFPQRYIKFLSSYNYVIGTDFSLYFDFPISLQIYNKYRNHWLSAYLSVNGIDIIPNISLSTPDCYDWSFLGYPIGSVVAFSDIGCIRDRSCREILFKAYDEMIRRLSPRQVLYFTRSKRYAPSEADIITIPFLKGGN